MPVSLPPVTTALPPVTIALPPMAAAGVDGWLCSRERVEIAQESKIFSSANLRA